MKRFLGLEETLGRGSRKLLLSYEHLRLFRGRRLWRVGQVQGRGMLLKRSRGKQRPRPQRSQKEKDFSSGPEGMIQHFLHL